MTSVSRGDLVELNGIPCVIIALAGERVGLEQVPEDHVAVWYGHTSVTLAGEGTSRLKPEVWTVPLEYIGQGQVPTVKH